LLKRPPNRPKNSGSPNGGPDYWYATCPGMNHSLEIRASTGEFFCGYCKRKGGAAELRAFVREREARDRRR